MSYRNIFIANEAKLKLKNKQLIVFNGEEISLMPHLITDMQFCVRLLPKQ